MPVPLSTRATSPTTPLRRSYRYLPSSPRRQPAHRPADDCVPHSPGQTGQQWRGGRPLQDVGECEGLCAADIQPVGVSGATRQAGRRDRFRRHGGLMPAGEGRIERKDMTEFDGRDAAVSMVRRFQGFVAGVASARVGQRIAAATLQRAVLRGRRVPV